MTKPNFLVLTTAESTPKDWLAFWATRYDEDADERVEDAYKSVRRNCKHLSSADFLLMGQWKDNALGKAKKGKWKPNVAMVAYRGWKKVARELPQCAKNAGVESFLREWSEKKYADTTTKAPDRRKRFGLSRATTILHFLSCGHYPILDRRVLDAIQELSGKRPSETVEVYFTEVCPFIRGLSGLCGCENARRMDNALFSYGASVRQLRRLE